MRMCFLEASLVGLHDALQIRMRLFQEYNKDFGCSGTLQAPCLATIPRRLPRLALNIQFSETLPRMELLQGDSVSFQLYPAQSLIHDERASVQEGISIDGWKPMKIERDIKASDWYSYLSTLFIPCPSSRKQWLAVWTTRAHITVPVLSNPMDLTWTGVAELLWQRLITPSFRS